MDNNNDFVRVLSDAVQARRDSLESTDLPRLKDECRIFQSAFSALYKIYLKKKYINEDPYKQETKMGEIQIPDASAFTEAERVEKLTIRLSEYDNQLDFLVNFYQFSVEFLNLERIKKIVSLVKYIDWVHLTPDVPLATTKAVAEMTNEAKIGTDPLTLSLISESTLNLNKSTGAIMTSLKGLSDFLREHYKMEVRIAITSLMPANEASQVALIKKKFPAALPGKPFYPDLIEEIIREDSPKDGPALREAVLKKLQVADKPKAVKKAVSFKIFLMEGVQGLSSTGTTLTETAGKLDENAALFANRKNGFWEKVKKVFKQMLNQDPDPVIYEISYVDPVKGSTVREKLDYQVFRTDMDRKIRSLSSLSGRGAAQAKLESMADDQLMAFLEKAIREIQTMHKILNALDDFFKREITGEDRGKVKGVKPELATLKNAIVRANQKRHEYSAQKEEEEQLKKLGIGVSGT
ncbi:hypothetical protein AGMMS49928_24200 [Spirochaetia bacterium]|nr:hypothetical protein AGMMS49928_24200 [Spirochaetia bacterium]